MTNISGIQYDINELAAMHDVSPSLIRKYEAMGLFSKSIARAKQNRRVFTAEDSDRLRIVLGLRDVAEPELVKSILDRLGRLKSRIKGRSSSDIWPSHELTPEEVAMWDKASEVETSGRVPSKAEETLKLEAEALAAILKRLLEKSERKLEVRQKFIRDFLRPVCQKMQSIAESAPSVHQIGRTKGKK